MEHKEVDLIIIGAGLTGLSLAYYLRESGLSVLILEARSRIGGRIYTKYSDGLAPIELGATWLGTKHTAINGLLKELELDIFIQELGGQAFYEPISTSPPQMVQLPPNEAPSYRIKGGSSVLINNLYDKLEKDQVLLDHRLISIEDHGSSLLLKTMNGSYAALKVVSTLPPNLILSSIKLPPHVDEQLIKIAKSTHTWMGESIKVALTFDKPFWREKSSGTIFSNVGPIPEMYDHSNVEDDLYALKGFFNGSYFSLSKEDRLQMVLGQLKKYYGEDILSFRTYEEKVWREDSNTFQEYQSHVLPHQNNGHQIFQQSFLKDKLYIAGAETASQFPGYMEGAVRSAQYIYNRLVN